MNKLHIETTSSERIVKIVSDVMLVRGSFEFGRTDALEKAPLAALLFSHPWVEKVLFSANFIALEVHSPSQWAQHGEQLVEEVAQYLQKGGAILVEENPSRRVPISIYVESTPNPAVIKFVANKKLVPHICEFKSVEEAAYSPLAKALFKEFSFVQEVFMDQNFVSVMRKKQAQWEEHLMAMRTFITEYIANGGEILSADAPKNTAELPKMDIMSMKIMSILEKYIRPAVASDGGNIQFVSYDPEKKLVLVQLQGACSGCPSSRFTLKNGIEGVLHQMLKDEEIRVEAVSEHLPPSPKKQESKIRFAGQ